MKQDGEVIRAVFAAFSARDINAALQHVTQDVECWAKVGMAHAGREHPYRGHEGIREYFGDVAANFTELEFDIQSARSVAGGATVFGSVRASPVGGESFFVPVTLMVRLRDHRVEYIRSMASMKAASAAPHSRASRDQGRSSRS